jgi:hypothetical protein
MEEIMIVKDLIVGFMQDSLTDVDLVLQHVSESLPEGKWVAVEEAIARVQEAVLDLHGKVDSFN